MSRPRFTAKDLDAIAFALGHTLAGDYEDEADDDDIPKRELLEKAHVKAHAMLTSRKRKAAKNV